MTTVSPAFTFSGVGTSLGKKSVAAATSFSATLDSTAGVNSVAWSITGTDDTTTAGNYTLVTSGPKGSTVTFTSGAAGTAGILSCTINGGVDPQTGSPSTDMTASAKWYVATGGLEVGCVNETTQSDSTFGWTVFINALIRHAAATSAITLTGTAPITIAGDNSPHDLSANRTIAIVAATGSVPGSMSAADKTKLDAATANNTAAVIMMRNDSKLTGLAGIFSDAGDTWSQAQVQNATGSGNKGTWTGQAAKSGAYNGGGFRWTGGDAGDASHWTGDLEWDLGREDDTVTRSAKARWYNGGGSPFLDLYTSGGVPTFDAGTGGLVLLDAGANGISINATKIGFFGATPASRPSAYTQTYATAARTVNAYTTDTESVAYTGIDNAQVGTPYAQLTDVNNLRTAYENLRASHDNLIQVVNSIIDDLQTLGLLQ